MTIRTELRAGGSYANTPTLGCIASFLAPHHLRTLVPLEVKSPTYELGRHKPYKGQQKSAVLIRNN